MATFTSKAFVCHKDYGRFKDFCNGNLHTTVKRIEFEKRERGRERKRLLIKCRSEGKAKGEIEKSEYLVKMMRESQPYFHAHRGSTFLLLFSSQFADTPFFASILEDISLLHGLGFKFVLVPETHVQINKLLVERGKEPKYVGPYRITDQDSHKASMEAAGGISIMMEAKLSAGPSLWNTRRHGDNSYSHDAGATVASGNFVEAKKRGVVDGIDYEATGEVKNIKVDSIRQRLDKDCIVMLSNLGHSSSGEVLNCNSYEVATACALALEAEKLIFIIDGPILDESGRLIRFLTLKDAEMFIHERTKQSEIENIYVQAVLGKDIFSSSYCGSSENGNRVGSGKHGFSVDGREKLSRANGYLSELAAAAFVCRRGVQRVHLLNGNTDGVLLLELFQRDGVGTMVASDLYEGGRMARETDIPRNNQLIGSIEESGALGEWTQ